MRIKKTLIFIFTILIVIAGFYQFMTYDRNYTWSKEIEYEVETICEVHGFHITTNAEQINVDNIKLSAERKSKILIQKILSKVNLMNYGQEFGVSFILKSNDSDGLLRCKCWCLSDYIIGLEIEYKNINPKILISLREDFNRYFKNDKIIWTQLQN